MVARGKGKFEYWLTADGLLLLEAWARDGLSNEQIANNCGIARSTLCKWRNDFPAIGEAVARGKEVVDFEVENALYKKATGYTVKLEKTFKVRRVEYDGGKRVAEQEELETRYDEVHVAADITAQKFWLANRKPDKWRDKPPERADSGEGGVTIVDDIP